MKPLTKIIVGGVLITSAAVPAVAAQQGPPAPAEMPPPVVKIDPAPVPNNTKANPWTSAREADAQRLAAAWAQSVVRGHPALRGLVVDSVSPVYNEGEPDPMGVHVEARLPGPVDAPGLTLFRGRVGLDGKTIVPEPLRANVKNLRGLSAMIQFADNQVYSLTPLPTLGEADSPETSTSVEFLEPAKIADSRLAAAPEEGE